MKKEKKEKKEKMYDPDKCGSFKMMFGFDQHRNHLLFDRRKRK
tara:strand:+ start:3590 stop:3718 length:129 start_codon:yes stop_codon:yes gene_type:complete